MAIASGVTQSPPPMGAVGGGENAGRFREGLQIKRMKHTVSQHKQSTHHPCANYKRKKAGENPALRISNCIARINSASRALLCNTLPAYALASRALTRSPTSDAKPHVNPTARGYTIRSSGC